MFVFQAELQVLFAVGGEDLTSWTPLKDLVHSWFGMSIEPCKHCAEILKKNVDVGHSPTLGIKKLNVRES